MSGLVRFEYEIPRSARTLECVHCGFHYSLEEAADLGEPMQCVDCMLSGFIPRRRQPVRDKFPGDLGARFTMVPDRLLNPNNGLNLTANQILVIIALESFRWGGRDVVFPSQERVAKMTRLSRRTVQRTLDGLVSAGLLGLRHDRSPGRYGRNEYDMSPLWNRLASPSPELVRAA